MKEIRKFQADDGAEFDDEKSCAEYEALCDEVAEVVSRLPARPESDGCRFANGDGCLQHNAADFYAARCALLQIANRIRPDKWFVQSLESTLIHSSWAGRLIGEMARPLRDAWYRIECTDGQLREWGQPYYASNPQDAKSSRRLN